MRAPDSLSAVLVEDLLAIDSLNENFRPESEFVEEGPSGKGNYSVLLGNVKFSSQGIKGLALTLIQLLSGNTPQFLAEELSKGRTLCYRRLYLGSGRFEVDSGRFVHAAELLRIRNRLFQALGLQKPRSPPEKCQITIFEGSNAIFEQDISKRIREAFPGCGINVLSPDLVNNLHSIISLLGKTTVLVSGSGDLVYLALFMPRYSTLLAIPGVDPETGQLCSPDAFFWKRIHWINKVYYPVNDAELMKPAYPLPETWSSSLKEGALQFAACISTNTTSLKRYLVHHVHINVDSERLIQTLKIALGRSFQLA